MPHSSNDDKCDEWVNSVDVFGDAMMCGWFKQSNVNGGWLEWLYNR